MQPNSLRCNGSRFCQIGVVLSVAIATVGCTEAPAPTQQRTTYRVVCTVGMVADIVREIVGDRAEVKGIIGQGVDPHLFQATRDDVAAISEADVVFYCGLKLEGKMEAIFKNISDQGRPVFAVTDSVPEDLLLAGDDAGGHHDPHVWMAPTLWKHAVSRVATLLSEYDPDASELYQANAEAYLQKVEALDAYARDSFATIPEKSRVLVTAHDAFNYMAQAYGFEVHGIQGISTESEAGIADVNALVDLLVERDVQAVFVESSVSEKNVRSLLEGAQSRGHEVVVGGVLFSDAMGKPGTYEGTYLGMIDHNITTIVRALGGTAPQRGMQDQLSLEP